MYRALLTTLEKKLESINAALRAIEKGRYGTCERCGEPIDPARLSAKPRCCALTASFRSSDSRRRLPCAA